MGSDHVHDGDDDADYDDADDDDDADYDDADDDDDGSGRTAADRGGRRDRTELYVRPSTVIMVLLVVAGFVLAAYALLEVARVLVWILAGSFLALAADPALRKLQAIGMPRGLALLALVAGAIGIVVLSLVLIVPPLVEQANGLTRTAPEALQELQQAPPVEWLDERIDLVDRVAAWLSGLPEQVAGSFGNVAGGIVTSLLGLVSIIAIAFLLLIYGERLVRAALAMFPQLAEPRRWQVIEGAYANVSAYIFGTLTVAVIDGLVMLGVLIVLDVPMPLPLALWVIVTAVVPVIGATIGTIPAMIVAFADEPWKALAIAVVIVVYQQVESTVIAPAIVGRVVRVSPLVVFVSFLVGADLLGIVGALLAVPVAGTVQIALQQELDRRRSRQPRLTKQALAKLDGDKPGDDEVDTSESGDA